MKKIVSETIDGSIKNIIQLKTLDASLEYSQLFDALEDCPQEFQSKLVGALNSLGETMQIPPTEVFNKVLCKSDEDEDVKKKLYNWWRAVFEVLSQCDIPDDRVEEYNQKVDDLMAEILKAGDGEATSEEEPEDVFAEEYEPASMKDEAKMLENMDFAIQELGEIATKVQDLVNFVNPYCGTEVNESGDQPKFKVGDVVRVMNASGMDFYGRDAPIGPIVEIQPPHPDVGVYEYLIKGRSGEFFAYEDELELVPERFTEEENSKMKKLAKERGGFGLEPDYDDLPDDWGSWNNYDGDEDDEGWDMDSADYEMSDDERKEAWRERHPYLEKGKDDGGPWLSEKEIIGMKVTGESGGEMSINLTSAEKADFESCVEDYIIQAEEKHGSESDMVIMTAASKALRWIEMICAKDCARLDPEDVIINWVDDGPEDEFAVATGNSQSVYDFVAEMYEEVSDYTMGSGTRGKPESDDEEFMEDGGQKLKNELKKGDDGWTTIGQPIGEATVVVDADTVWDVLELLDDDVANQNLTELINSHTRSEEEIMDAIENILGASGYSDNVPKAALNGMFSSDNIHELIEELGLDVDAYMDRGVIQDADKPTSVELESREAGETKKVTLYVDWDDDGAGIDSNVVIDVPAEIADSEESDALYDYIMDWIDHQDFCVNDWAITDIEGLMDEGSEEGKKPDEVKSQDKTFNQDGETKTLVAGEGEKKEMSDAEAATIMGGASATDMDAADIGVSSHEVADPYKKPVCEMTVEQEVDDPWKLSEMLWSQGKENLQELLRSELVGEEDIMMLLEDVGLRNLTEINDYFSFDFENVLDSLGLDAEAWSQNLEIKRKGEEPVDEAKKKTKGAGDPEAQKIEDAIPVDDKDGFIKIEKDERYGAGAYVAYYAPGSEPEITPAAAELRKALPEYQIYTSDNQILLLPKKNRK